MFRFVPNVGATYCSRLMICVQHRILGAVLCTSSFFYGLRIIFEVFACLVHLWMIISLDGLSEVPNGSIACMVVMIDLRLNHTMYEAIYEAFFFASSKDKNCTTINSRHAL